MGGGGPVPKPIPPAIHNATVTYFITSLKWTKVHVFETNQPFMTSFSTTKILCGQKMVGIQLAERHLAVSWATKILRCFYIDHYILLLVLNPLNVDTFGVPRSKQCPDY